MAACRSGGPAPAFRWSPGPPPTPGCWRPASADPSRSSSYRPAAGWAVVGAGRVSPWSHDVPARSASSTVSDPGHGGTGAEAYHSTIAGLLARRPLGRRGLARRARPRLGVGERDGRSPRGVLPAPLDGAPPPRAPGGGRNPLAAPGDDPAAHRLGVRSRRRAGGGGGPGDGPLAAPPRGARSGLRGDLPDPQCALPAPGELPRPRRRDRGGGHDGRHLVLPRRLHHHPRRPADRPARGRGRRPLRRARLAPVRQRAPARGAALHLHRAQARPRLRPHRGGGGRDRGGQPWSRRAALALVGGPQGRGHVHHVLRDRLPGRGPLLRPRRPPQAAPALGAGRGGALSPSPRSRSCPSC